MILNRFMTVVPMIGDINPVTPPGVEEKVTQILGWVMWAGGAVAILGFIAAGIMLILSNNSGQANESARWVGRVAIGAVLVTGSAALAKFITG